MNYKHVILIISAVLISLIFVEFLLGKLNYYPRLDDSYYRYTTDKYLPYKPKPLSVVTGVNMTGEFEYEYRHNSIGLRDDKEYKLLKPADTYRILGLGDSFTYGAGVKIESTFLSRTENRFNSAQNMAYRVEIVKAGIPGYFTEIEKDFLKYYGIKYSPDLVIVFILENDVIDTYQGADYKTADRLGFLKTRRGQNLGYISKYLFNNTNISRLILMTFLKYTDRSEENITFKDIIKNDSLFLKIWQEIENQLVEMVNITKHNDSELLLVSIPQRGQIRTKRDLISRKLQDFAVKNNIRFLDVMPALVNASKLHELYYVKDGHLNSYGHLAVANCLHDYLKLNSLVH